MRIPTRTTCVDRTRSSRSVVLLAQRRAPILMIHPKPVHCSVYKDASANLDLSESLYMATAFRNVSVPATEVSKEEKDQLLFQPYGYNKCEQLP